MMPRSSARACALAVLVLAAAAQAADAPPAGDGWSSYGVGTTIHTKSTTKTTMATPGAPAMPEQVTENRITLTAVTDKEYTLKSEAKLGEEWNAQEMKLPRVAAGEAKAPEGAKVEELGEEAVTIEGTSIPCKKTRTTLGANVTTSWTHAKHGLVKSEGKGPGSEYTSIVTKLSTKATAGGKELDCKETTTTAKAEGSESTVVMLTSDQIPGKTVRMESTTKIPQAQMTSSMVMEVVSFEIK